MFSDDAMHRLSRTLLLPGIMMLASCAVVNLPDIGTALNGGASLSQTAGSGGPVMSVGGAAARTFKARTSSLVLSVGDELPLQSLLSTADGQVPTETFVWTSSNVKLAAIEPLSNSVRGIQSGTAILTATLSSDPGVKVSIEVAVVENRSVKLIKVLPGTPTLVVGEAMPLRAEVYLADGQINGNVTWSSSDNTIAVVNPTTGVVTGLKEGKVSIVAAFALDPKFKGLSALSVVAVKPEVDPSATTKPNDIFFRPGATPLPDRSSAPVQVSASSPGSDAWDPSLGGTYLGGDGRPTITGIVAGEFSGLLLSPTSLGGKIRGFRWEYDGVSGPVLPSEKTSRYVIGGNYAHLKPGNVCVVEIEYRFYGEYRKISRKVYVPKRGIVALDFGKGGDDTTGASYFLPGV
jgi:hypothetical protein